MKYCLQYSNISKKLKNADEISIIYREDKGLLNFMEKFSKQKIVLRITASSFSQLEIDKLIAIKKVYPKYNFIIAMDEYDYNLMKIFRENDLSFYINIPCTDWETFYELTINQKVSAINIGGPLGFELPKVKQFLESNNLTVQIRAIANKAFCANGNTPSLIKFYIRPDDVKVYEPYIDIIEFEDVARQDTFYNIYTKELFIGNLNQIIFNFNDSVDNKMLPTLFSERRIDCGHQCLKGGRCHRCFTMKNIANNLKERAIEQIKDNIENTLKELSSKN